METTVIVTRTEAPSWRDRAIAAHQAAVAQSNREAAEYRLKQEIATCDRLIAQLAKLGIGVSHADLTYETETYHGRASVELDGVEFSVNGGDLRAPLYASVPCPDCDGRRSVLITSIGDLGYLLTDPDNACSFHEHWYNEGSTHPKAPAPWDRKAAPSEPTPAEQLEDLIVRIAAAQALGGA